MTDMNWNFFVFIELVKNMRAAQCAYFKSRSAKNLTAAKELEAKVDRCLVDLSGPLPLLPSDAPAEEIGQ